MSGSPTVIHAGIDPREFGALEAKVAHLEKMVQAQSEKMDQLIELANRGKGAYWAGLFIAGAIGTLIPFIAGFFQFRSGG